MPPIAGGEHIIDMLFELGVSNSSNSAIEFSEIKAWSELTGTVLTSFEALTIRELSSAYVIQLNKSVNRHEPAPYYVGSDAERKQSVDDKLRLVALRSKSKW